MMQIPEATQWLPQNTPIYLEGRMPMMLPAAARELGLHAGQVVPAVVRVEGERLELLLHGRSIEVPPGWRVSPGETVWITAHATVNGLWVLRRAPGPAGPGAPSDLVGLSASAAATEQAAVADAGAASRLRQLWFHPTGMAALMGLLQPEVLDTVLRSPGLAQWAQSIAAMRMTMGKVTERDVKQALESALTSTEARLALGQPAPANDLKQSLFRLLRSLQASGASEAGLNGDAVRAALDDIEGAQVDAARAWSQREVLLSTVLPFADAPPVYLTLKRERERQAGQETRWWLDLYTESASLGQVWMQSALNNLAVVDMRVWATEAKVVQDARARSQDLADLLTEAGLALRDFRVTLGVKPSQRVDPIAPHGSVLDVQA